MKSNKTILLAGLWLSLCASFAPAAEPVYQLVKDIPVPGKAQWDYLRVDSEAHRLYLSHGSKVEVIDLDKGAVVGTIEDTPGVHGMAVVPKLGRVFTSNGQENKASIVDIKTLKTIAKVPTGANPDSIMYEETQNEVYTFNGKGRSATVFNAESGKVVATLDLGGKPEMAMVDGKAGRIFVNLEDKNEVAVIDLKAHKVLSHWPIAPGEAATGMAIDLEKHRLFLGCDNKQMVLMDYTSGKVLSTATIGAGVDGCAFDPALGLAFSSNGEDGTVTVVKETSPGKLAVVQTLKTAVGARTITIDPQTHRIYLPAPTPSFRVLVFGPGK